MDRMFDLRKLRHFVVLIETGSFVRAAARVNLSQPALSRSIQSLESEVGTALLERRQGKMQPSVVGQRLLREGRRLLRNAARLHEDARLWAAGEAGDLAIGMGPMVAALLGSFALRCVGASRPAANLTLLVSDGGSLQSRLNDLELDFMVASRSAMAGSRTMIVESLAQIPLGLLVRPGHPLLGRESIGWADLAAYPLACGAGLPEDLGWSIPSCPRLLCDNYQVLAAVTASSDAVWISTPLLANRGTEPSLLTLPHPVERWYPDHTEIAVARVEGRELSPIARVALELLQTWTPAVDRDHPLSGSTSTW